MKFSKWFAAALMMVAAGCAAPDRPSTPDLSEPGVGGGGGDDAGAPDLATADDLATSHDLAGAHDLATSHDLAGHDLASTPDLLMPSDLATSPDLATLCMPPVAGGACGDYPPQCGCASGQNCSVVNNSTGATGCVATGSIGNWSGGCSGSGAGQCGIGASCVDGICTPICKTAADCGGGTYTTCEQVQAGNNDIPGFTVCTHTCDPVNPQSTTSPYMACGASTNCLPASNHASSCFAPVGSSTQGGDCTTGGGPDLGKCAATFACLQDNILGDSSCYKMCHVGSNADCTATAAGKTCMSFGTKLYAGAAEIGYCD